MQSLEPKYRVKYSLQNSAWTGRIRFEYVSYSQISCLFFFINTLYCTLTLYFCLRLHIRDLFLSMTKASCTNGASCQQSQEVVLSISVHTRKMTSQLHAIFFRLFPRQWFIPQNRQKLVSVNKRNNIRHEVRARRKFPRFSKNYK